MTNEQIMASITRRRIAEAYHYIDLAYLPNVVRRGGLWCARRLREWGDNFDDNRQKWGDWSKGEEFSEYVSCAVNAPMGMMERSANLKPVIVRLSPEVMAGEGVIFIGKWSSFADISHGNCQGWTGVEYFDQMFLAADRYRANPHPGEFLVPEHIPWPLFKQIVFYEQQDLDDARAAIKEIERAPSLTQIPALVDKVPFGRITREVEE